MTRDDFTAGKTHSRRRRGPRRVTAVLNGYVYQIENVRNELAEDVHGCGLKFYHDCLLETAAIMSHVLSSVTGMLVQRLLRIVDTGDGVKVQVRWLGQSRS